MLHDRVVEVHEALGDSVPLPAAVRAPRRGAVHERVVRADVRGRRVPLLGVIRHLAEEDEDGEAAPDFELPDANPHGPLPQRLGRQAPDARRIREQDDIASGELVVFCGDLEYGPGIVRESAGSEGLLEGMRDFIDPGYAVTSLGRPGKEIVS